MRGYFKKGIIGVLIVSFLTLGVFSYAFAASKGAAIGIIDKQKVLTNHPKFAEVQKKIRNAYQSKKAEAEKAVKNVKDNKKRQQIIAQKEREFFQIQQKLMKPIISDIELAMRKVAKRLKLSVVLDKAVVLYGGRDITQDVIQELKKQYAKK